MARQLELSPRLRLLADWVPSGARLVDVGTDHGYLPAWLILNGRAASAVAGDLRRGPLERAKATGRRYSVADAIDYRLCDGLAGVSPEECDTIVIAGMGGENIAAILSRAPWTADGKHLLLLQPQSRAEELRRFLASHGYAILEEKLAEERGTLYTAMKAMAGEMSLTRGQALGGARLSRDPLGDRYLIEKLVRLHMALAGAKRSGATADRSKAEELRADITALLELREEWRHADGR